MLILLAILNKKLYTETENFEMATTKEELGSTESIAVEIDGIKAYIGLDNDLSLSKFKIEKDKKYAVKKEAIPPVVPGSQNYLTAGTHTFTAPYTTKYTIEIAGAGGGGGGNCVNGRGGSGGRGASTTVTLNLVKGHTYTVVVGAGGGAGGSIGKDYNYNRTAGSGGTGGTSSFNGANACRGGNGGGGASSTANGRWGGKDGDVWLTSEPTYHNGGNGASYGNGGAGGGSAQNGATGWVKITWK